MNNSILSMVLTAFLVHSLCAIAHKAVVITPVADLLGSPADTLAIYDTLPLCGGKTNPFVACTRINQLLFNEVVEVLEIKNGQAKINVPHLFFITLHDNMLHTTYWMKQKDIVSFQELKKRGCNIDYIPPAIDFKKKSLQHAPTITLVRPYFDPVTHHYFSAGTRFVYNKENSQHTYAAHVFDHSTYSFKTALIPQNYCIVTSRQRNKSDAIKQFLALLHHWAHQKENAIPYVWGGCSFVHTSKKSNYEEKSSSTHSFFTRNDFPHHPKTGFDCTGLIARAAQLAGIPYFLKNSTTIAAVLRPLKNKEAVEEGDIIWIPHHAMVVSSLKHNLLIEARHYSQGYGIVHEIPLQEEFKNIATYQDLVQAISDHKPLLRTNKKGTVVEVVRDIKIFKLSSCWDHTQKYSA